ncbi:hypothetical protein GV64_10705 [Endozoicomonas elysicola]|uniref:H repeat-associated protein N-terminal domain-containing protein n=2 Tax=Endozoicomonas elysicola TaxID=305900 RepID=A0A081KAH4_9GAMM|nr:hypothetical protein GV64_10705 [Endozoicomonas elysicola]
MNVFNLMENFSIIYGPRQSGRVEHKPSDTLLLLIICAVIASAEGWEEIEDFGLERLDWLK